MYQEPIREKGMFTENGETIITCGETHMDGFRKSISRAVYHHNVELLKQSNVKLLYIIYIYL